MCIGLFNFIWLLVMGVFFDCIGCKLLLLGVFVLVLLIVYLVLFWLVCELSFVGLFGVELWLLFFYSSYNGVMVVVLIEVMLVDVCIMGFFFVYSLVMVIFGGFILVVCIWLIYILDNCVVLGIWFSGVVLLGLFVILVLFCWCGKEIVEVELVNV